MDAFAIKIYSLLCRHLSVSPVLASSTYQSPKIASASKGDTSCFYPSHFITSFLGVAHLKKKVCEKARGSGKSGSRAGLGMEPQTAFIVVASWEAKPCRSLESSPSRTELPSLSVCLFSLSSSTSRRLSCWPRYSQRGGGREGSWMLGM